MPTKTHTLWICDLCRAETTMAVPGTPVGWKRIVRPQTMAYDPCICPACLARLVQSPIISSPILPTRAASLPITPGGLPDRPSRAPILRVGSSRRPKLSLLKKTA